MTDETIIADATESTATADDALFEAGFGGDDSIPTGDSRPDVEEPQAEPAADAPAAPKYAQVTEDQLNSLLTAAGELDKLRSSQDKAFGKIGDIQRTLTQLRESQTTQGEITLSDEDINKLEFPEVARELIPFIQSRVRAAAPAATNFDPTQIESLAEQIADKKLTMMSMENLDDEVQGWRQIVGLPDDKGAIPETPYRKWLAVQPEEYRSRVNTTNNGALIHRSIKLFQKAEADAQAAAKKVKNARQDRFDSAVQPRGTGEHAPMPDAQDDFDAGFQSG